MRIRRKKPQAAEDQAEVVAGGGEDGIGLVAGAALQVISPEVTIALRVADHRLHGGAASELLLDDAEDAALLARAENAQGVRRAVSAIALIDVDALDRAAGQGPGPAGRGGCAGTLARGCSA